jgi:hypothetical protein
MAVRFDYPMLNGWEKKVYKQKPKTTRNGLQALQDAPLILNPAEEPLNSMSIKNGSNVNSPVDSSKPVSHWGSGYNSQSGASISGHSVFVLDVNGKPLTSCKPSKARKLMKGKQAEPVWNKFGMFGIQMLVEVGNKTPETVLGVDFGTKFEGYAIAIGKENNLSVMWLLPDKKHLVKKLKTRSQLRRARRSRNCRRRERRRDNREKDGFIAPSQLMMVQSRLKAIREFFKCYPITDVAMEDVKFNHRDNRWGKNFSTVEIGKKMINDWIKERAHLYLFRGMDTEDCRDRYGYKKSSNKGAETFNSHCSDALAIATDLHTQKNIEQGPFIVVDDRYRPVRRRLHDTQPSTGGIRYPYSSGNFNGVRKGVICEFGQICGGIKEKNIRIYNKDKKRIARKINKITWLSHKFKKIKEDFAITKPIKIGDYIAR